MGTGTIILGETLLEILSFNPPLLHPATCMSETRETAFPN